MRVRIVNGKRSLLTRSDNFEIDLGNGFKGLFYKLCQLFLNLRTFILSLRKGRMGIPFAICFNYLISKKKTLERYLYGNVTVMAG